jgi:TctA family transporter
MKLERRGSVFAILGGILAVMSSVDSSGNSIIPEVAKIFGGIALIVFGLSRLLFQYENKEEQKKNRKIALLIVSLLAIGVVGYFFFQGSEPKRKLFAKRMEHLRSGLITEHV